MGTRGQRQNAWPRISTVIDVFYFGARLEDSLSRAFGDSGYRIVRTRYTKGVLSSSPNCGAVVLHWKSVKGQQIIAEAKAARVPILVITSKLTAAIQAGEPFADLYLEEPARDEEVVMMLLDKVIPKPLFLVASAVAR
jgi:DNA-binding response OmpR family regulator